MELFDLINRFKQILNIDDIKQAQQKLIAVLFNCAEKERLFDE